MSTLKTTSLTLYYCWARLYYCSSLVGFTVHNVIEALIYFSECLFMLCLVLSYILFLTRVIKFRYITMCNHFANAYFHDEDSMTANSRHQNKGMVVRMALSHTHDHHVYNIYCHESVLCIHTHLTRVYFSVQDWTWACEHSSTLLYL